MHIEYVEFYFFLLNTDFLLYMHNSSTGNVFWSIVNDEALCLFMKVCCEQFDVIKHRFLELTLLCFQSQHA